MNSLIKEFDRLTINKLTAYALEIKFIELTNLLYVLFLKVDHYESTDYDLDHSQDLFPKVYRSFERTNKLLEEATKLADEDCQDEYELYDLYQDYLHLKKNYNKLCEMFEEKKLNFV